MQAEKLKDLTIIAIKGVSIPPTRLPAVAIPKPDDLISVGKHSGEYKLNVVRNIEIAILNTSMLVTAIHKGR
eukprot:CAMPEP_0201541198 /NCGR_PEP_ID=MMETSP0161_2-20130828/71349_1 /ASSEMBLY_ACC=CAM_ASM_000251 /TAXON_ID=180227 /ORGANISM="Neoparamoeba aestuarina, Strain SoJaBio B1-5/56/2" /LENGTH=71 /DNA_ID=CAMNT_0047948715 /DNA_START=72 /DNA_END=287 /DNA_ORIENTATION=+